MKLITLALLSVMLLQSCSTPKNKFFIERFYSDSILNLIDQDTAFSFNNGRVSRKGNDESQSADRHYIHTKMANFLTKDFVYEVTLRSAAESQFYLPDDIIFIGIGEATSDAAYFNEPKNSVTFRVHEGSESFGTGRRVDVSANISGGKNSYFQTIGHLPNILIKGEPVRFQIIKNGKKVTFKVLGMKPEISHTIANISKAAPFLNSENTYLFFGNASSSYAFDDMIVVPTSPKININ